MSVFRFPASSLLHFGLQNKTLYDHRKKKNKVLNHSDRKVIAFQMKAANLTFTMKAFLKPKDLSFS